MAFDIKKFVNRFVEEARDHLESLNRGLVELEKSPEDKETLNSVFRSAHTIKGSSRMLKLTYITEVAHRLEDVLGALREGKIALSGELSNLMFRSVDALSAMVEKTSAGDEVTADNSALCEQLMRASEEGAGGGKGQDEKKAGAATGEAPAEKREIPPPPAAPEEPEPDKKIISSTETIRVKAEKLDDLIKLMGEVVTHQNKLKQRLLDIAYIESEAKSNLEFLGAHGGEEILAAAKSLYGGLKQLLSRMRQDKTMQDVLTAEFQEKALMMRMVPLSTVFGPLHRLVRDMSGSLGKSIDFEIEGGEIELDKKIVEKLGDPLVHMLRNSLDHGIEKEKDREKAGKPARGKIRLTACYDAGTILLEIHDDGAGISTGRIKEKALSKNLFDADTLDDMTESALLDLIFLPGVSTSGIITDISGRGVGMDVVKKNIVEDMRGSVNVRTREGRGCTFTIRLPMTLAIMRVLLVTCRGRTFGITTNNVTEILKVTEDDIFHVTDRRALRLREEFVPLADLGSLLDMSKGGEEAEKMLVLVTRVGNEKMGFIVDALLDEEDMVIKSLPDHMKSVRLVSGVTVSGRNEIIHVLNVTALMEEAGRAKEKRIEREPAGDEKREFNILVVDDSVNTREIEKSILEAYGYKVTVAGDGVEAMEEAANRQYDLVVTDVEMPRLDGFSLTEKLRSEESYVDVPIIIVTSREKDEDKRRGIEVGANAYIIKGAFDQGNLIETVHNLIGKG